MMRALRVQLIRALRVHLVRPLRVRLMRAWHGHTHRGPGTHRTLNLKSPPDLFDPIAHGPHSEMARGDLSRIEPNAVVLDLKDQHPTFVYSQPHLGLSGPGMFHDVVQSLLGTAVEVF